MFNIHSTELLLVAIVALIVIGPEKLPMAIRTASLWIGRFRRSFHKVKSDIERELNADEIRRQLHNESVMAEIEEAKSNIEKTAKDTESKFKNIVSSDDFDPGAPKESYQEEAKEQIETAKQELEDVGKEVAEAGKQLYGTGKNPKLADPQELTEPNKELADNTAEQSESDAASGEGSKTS
ncbi:MAG: Sec-independent protein translocase protein TatB [Gammaproteobacteria bacterium]